MELLFDFQSQKKRMYYPYLPKDIINSNNFTESVDKMKTYTYNKGTVWFLSTPILILRCFEVSDRSPFGGPFFYLYALK